MRRTIFYRRALKAGALILGFIIMGLTVTACKANRQETSRTESTGIESGRQARSDASREMPTKAQGKQDHTPLLELELWTGVDNRLFDAEAPLILSVNLYSPKAFEVLEANLDREGGTADMPAPDLPDWAEEPRLWENLTIVKTGPGERAPVRCSVFPDIKKEGFSLAEGDVLTATVSVHPDDLQEDRIYLQAVLAAAGETLLSKDLEITVQRSAWPRESNLRAWIFYHRNLGEHEEALGKVEELVTIQPEDPAGYSFKSLILEDLGRLEEARENVMRAIDLYTKTNPEELPVAYINQLKRISKIIDSNQN